jgi:hypothetical protein
LGDLFEPVAKLKQKLPRLDDLLASGAVEEKQRHAIAAQASERAEEMARKAERRGSPPATSRTGASRKKSIRSSTKSRTPARPSRKNVK